MGPNEWYMPYLFWMDVIVCLVLVAVLIRLEIRYQRKREKLKQDINSPGLKDIKWLFKHKLKEHGIDENDKTNSSS